jgi:hypothetical protein
LRNLIGGPTIDHVDKIEEGTRRDENFMFLNGLQKKINANFISRFAWFLWLQISLFCVLIPFVPELAIIPIVGGSLLHLSSQSLVMLSFSAVLGCAIQFFISFLIWSWNCYSPFRGLLFLALSAGCVCLTIFVGEPIPPEIARYLLGVF